MAHRMAMVGERVRAEVYEVSEFPDIVERYSIMGVPKVVVNEDVQFEGGVPEENFLRAVLQAVDARALSSR